MNMIALNKALSAGLVGFIGIALLVLGLWTYTRAAGAEITACVNKSGEVYVIGTGFEKANCSKNETLLSWGIQGPKGDKGDPGSTGAGNIAFTDQDQGLPVVVKADGTVWQYTRQNNPP